MFTLVFIQKTASFRLHAEGCAAATAIDGERYAWPESFPTAQAAYEFARQDEWERSSSDTKVEDVKPYGWKLCACCKRSKS